jgi:hypothetical protein
LFLSLEIARLSPAVLADRLRQVIEAGRRVFVAPDVIEVSPVSRASYGPRYVAYVQELRGHVCEVGPPRGGLDEMPLREVTCFDGRVVSHTPRP